MSDRGLLREGKCLEIFSQRVSCRTTVGIRSQPPTTGHATNNYSTERRVEAIFEMFTSDFELIILYLKSLIGRRVLFVRLGLSLGQRTACARRTASCVGRVFQSEGIRRMVCLVRSNASVGASGVDPTETAAMKEADVVLHFTVFALLLVLGLSFVEVMRGYFVHPHFRLASQGVLSQAHPRYGALENGVGDDSFEALLALSDSMGHVSVGFTDEQIRIFPTCLYSRESRESGVRDNSKYDVGDMEKYKRTEFEEASRTADANCSDSSREHGNENLENVSVAECEETACAICREDLLEGDELLILPCQCLFHKACIARWLSGSASCPLCRCSFA